MSKPGQRLLQRKDGRDGWRLARGRKREWRKQHGRSKEAHQGSHKQERSRETEKRQRSRRTGCEETNEGEK